MPKGKGLYKRKGARGRIMYFRDGKMISKKSFLASTARRGSAKRSSPRRSTRRKTTMARRRTYSRRKPAMPHPSITGMAAGLSVANYLNSGKTVSTGMAGLSAKSAGVIKDIADGKLNDAFGTLSANAVNLATSTAGKQVLSTSIVLATAGGLARKWFPSVKLGGNKLYFKI